MVTTVNDSVSITGSKGRGRRRAPANGAVATRPAASEQPVARESSNKLAARDQLHTLADLSARFCEGAACLIAWQGAGDAQTIRAVPDSRAESLLNSILAAIERDPRYQSAPNPGLRSNTSSLRFPHSELAAVCAPWPRTTTCAAITISRPTAGGASAIDPKVALPCGAVREEMGLRVTVILTAPCTPHRFNLATPPK